MTPACRETLDLLDRALQLMDAQGLHMVAARIAMAIDDLEQGGVVRRDTRR